LNLGIGRHFINMGIEKILLCCNANNRGSVKTIIGNSGILDSKGIFNGEKILRFWITLLFVSPAAAANGGYYAKRNVFKT
jgi:hypothetical protein